MPRIIIESHSDSPWRVGGISIELDGRTLGKASPNSRSDFLISAGSHSLCVKSGSAKSPSVSIRAVERETLTFVCSVSGVISPEVSLKPLPRRQSDNRFNHARDVDYGHLFDDIVPWHVVLGVSEMASMVDVKAAYIAEMLKVHPDKTSHMSEAERQVAHQQATKLNIAYGQAKKKHSARAGGS
jgi:hypothetical protein